MKIVFAAFVIASLAQVSFAQEWPSDKDACDALVQSGLDKYIPSPSSGECVQLLQVTWPLSNTRALLGNVVDAGQIQGEPTYNFPNFDSSKTYIVSAVDFDPLGPNNEDLRQVCYEVRCGVSNAQLTGGGNQSSRMEPTPMFGTGVHRYGIVVIEAEDGVQCEEPEIRASDIASRVYFNVADLVHKYGKLVAFNYVRVGFEINSFYTNVATFEPYPEYVNRAIARLNVNVPPPPTK